MDTGPKAQTTIYIFVQSTDQLTYTNRQTGIEYRIY